MTQPKAPAEHRWLAQRHVLPPRPRLRWASPGAALAWAAGKRPPPRVRGGPHCLRRSSKRENFMSKMAPLPSPQRGTWSRNSSAAEQGRGPSVRSAPGPRKVELEWRASPAASALSARRARRGPGLPAAQTSPPRRGGCGGLRATAGSAHVGPAVTSKVAASIKAKKGVQSRASAKSAPPWGAGTCSLETLL